MNKFRYGNRTIYEKDGRYLKYLDGNFTGEDDRNKAFSWLYEARPYRLDTTKIKGGYKGVIKDTTGGRTVAEAAFYRSEDETENEAWARLCDWAARYIGGVNSNHES
jgi:hypothetical protein